MVIAILGYSIPCIYLCHHKYNLTDSFYFLKMASVIFSCKKPLLVGKIEITAAIFSQTWKFWM